ncbi:MAG TPA: hypothetical protein VHN37_00105 [Actinomycetota bacterium]|nr:hypothetical protein [Actinomycetota bacterium]
MRRTWVVVAVAGAILAASPLAPKTAFAADVKECLEREFTFHPSTVRLEGLNIVIDPNAIPSDVDAVISLAGQIVDFASCVEGGHVTGPVGCWGGLAFEIATSLDPTNGNLRYVTRNPETGVITVHTETLLADATRCPFT